MRRIAIGNFRNMAQTDSFEMVQQGIDEPLACELLGFVRIALVENEHRIRQAARNVKKFLAKSPETLHNVIPLTQASR